MPRPPARPPLLRTAAAGLALIAGGDAFAATPPVTPPGRTGGAASAPATPVASPAPSAAGPGATPLPSPAAPAVSSATPADAADSWPKDFQVTIALDIGTPAIVKGYRPYIAFWIEDSDHQMIRTLGVLGKDSRFANHLSGWRRAGGVNYALSAVTRATRPNGIYTIAWDGRDDYGHPMPQDTYTICVELVREEGRHVTTTATIVCGAGPAEAVLAATVESGTSQVAYGPKPASAPATPLAAPATPAPAAKRPGA